MQFFFVFSCIHALETNGPVDPVGSIESLDPDGTVDPVDSLTPLGSLDPVAIVLGSTRNSRSGFLGRKKDRRVKVYMDSNNEGSVNSDDDTEDELPYEYRPRKEITEQFWFYTFHSEQ